MPANFAGHTFKPGKSGNAGGRTKGLERRIREKLGDLEIDELIDVLLLIARSTSEETKDRLKAVEMLFDRVGGKPRQSIEGEISVGASAADLALLAALRLTPEERRRKLAEIDAEDDKALSAGPPPDDHGD